MRLNRRAEESLHCPFCGAPQRQFVPVDAVQIKCKYCGGVFLIQSATEQKRLGCCEHPERVSIGLCNDCERSFCGDCLHVYYSNVRAEEATLYLCPSCLRERYVEKANSFLDLGVILLVVAGIGFFYWLCFLPSYEVLMPAFLFLVLGVLAVAYSFFKRKKIAFKELAVNELPKRVEV